MRHRAFAVALLTFLMSAALPASSLAMGRQQADGSLFEIPCIKYSGELAALSLELSDAASNKENARSFLEENGFSHIVSENYEKSPDDEAHTCAFTVASKRINRFGKNIKLICAAAGAARSIGEWKSTLDPTGGDVSAIYSSAALTAGAEIYNSVTAMCSGVSGDYIVWLAGYGRGGAAINYAASRLSGDSVFAYTFSAPGVSRSGDTGSDRYANIFNLTTAEDINGVFPLRDWGFERYGTDISADVSGVSGDVSALKAELMTFAPTLNSYYKDRQLAYYDVELLKTGANTMTPHELANAAADTLSGGKAGEQLELALKIYSCKSSPYCGLLRMCAARLLGGEGVLGILSNTLTGSVKGSALLSGSKPEAMAERLKAVEYERELKTALIDGSVKISGENGLTPFLPAAVFKARLLAGCAASKLTENKTTAYYDLSLSVDGVEIQPGCPVTVSLPYDGFVEMSAKNYRVFRLDEHGKPLIINGFEYENGTVTFETGRLGVFAVGQTGSNYSYVCRADGRGRLTVTVDMLSRSLISQTVCVIMYDKQGRLMNMRAFELPQGGYLHESIPAGEAYSVLLTRLSADGLAPMADSVLWRRKTEDTLPNA